MSIVWSQSSRLRMKELVYKNKHEEMVAILCLMFTESIKGEETYKLITNKRIQNVINESSLKCSKCHLDHSWEFEPGNYLSVDCEQCISSINVSYQLMHDY